MSHFIIIGGKLREIKGNATTGSAADLLTAFEAAHAAQADHSDKAVITAIDAKFEEIENALVCGEGLSSGITESFDQFTADLNALVE